MILPERSELARIEQAYRVVGVLPDSSALHIKRAYRRLARSWHPDTFPHNSPQQRRATERMREINDAFQLIKHAPLRFRVEVQPGVATPTVGSTVRRTTPVTDTAEYVVRSIVGAAFGLFLSLELFRAGAPLAVVALVPVLTGGASAVFGDSFWYWVLKFWWLWRP